MSIKLKRRDTEVDDDEEAVLDTNIVELPDAVAESTGTAAFVSEAATDDDVRVADAEAV